MINKSELYAKCIKRWGESAQCLQAMEECGELIVAINKFAFRGAISVDDLASEIADVEITTEQLRAMIGNDIVDKAKHEKLMRLAVRVDL